MRQRSRQVLRLRNALTETGYPRGDAELVRQLVQEATSRAYFTATVLAGNDQERNRVCIGLTHSRNDIGEAGARDGEAHAHAA